MATATSLKLPAIGLGTGPLRGDGGIALMAEAIGMGYRLLDTAAHYGNEREVGEAVRASGVPRDEIVVMTKIWPDHISGTDLPHHAEAALQRLGPCSAHRRSFSPVAAALARLQQELAI